MNDFTRNRHHSNNPFAISLPCSNLWVFGYGSLMWKPGFRYLDCGPARLYGFSRRLCLWSIHYRGTPERPGLVVGLIPGGSC
ncbi:MAG: gamma-glutamylcyclotransferase, partial [Gammaproteobacteria bacterium]|nr:gamma-glutamylcyclotransferase [Gammaproteobacteria bacterium]